MRDVIEGLLIADIVGMVGQLNLIFERYGLTTGAPFLLLDQGGLVLPSLFSHVNALVFVEYVFGFEVHSFTDPFHLLLEGGGNFIEVRL